MTSDSIEKLERLLPANSRASVSYCNPGFGQQPPMRARDLALIEFPNDINLEVTWDPDGNQFVVTISRDHFDSVIQERRFPDIVSTMTAIKRYAQVADIESLNASVPRKVVSAMTHEFESPRTFPHKPQSEGRVLLKSGAGC